jgi:hypothetical protein
MEKKDKNIDKEKAKPRQTVEVESIEELSIRKKLKKIRKVKFQTDLPELELNNRDKPNEVKESVKNSEIFTKFPNDTMKSNEKASKLPTLEKGDSETTLRNNIIDVVENLPQIVKNSIDKKTNAILEFSMHNLIKNQNYCPLFIIIVTFHFILLNCFAQINRNFSSELLGQFKRKQKRSAFTFI